MDVLDDLAGADEAGAFKLPGRVFMAGAPGKIAVDEFFAAVGPAAVADMIINNPVRGIKLINGNGKAADHNDGDPYAPGQPGQTAGEADEKVGMGEQVYPLLQGTGSGKIFDPVRNQIPVAAAAVTFFFVDAQHPVAPLF